ncbi:hypothetical protein R6Q59_000155 [Mikania micrantha]
MIIPNIKLLASIASFILILASNFGSNESQHLDERSEESWLNTGKLLLSSLPKGPVPPPGNGCCNTGDCGNNYGLKQRWELGPLIYIGHPQVGFQIPLCRPTPQYPLPCVNCFHRKGEKAKKVARLGFFDRRNEGQGDDDFGESRRRLGVLRF